MAGVRQGKALGSSRNVSRFGALGCRLRGSNRVSKCVGPSAPGQVLGLEPVVQGVVGIELVDSIAAVVHSMKRQRLDRLSRDGVLVRVLFPAVENDHPVSYPAGWKRRQRGGVELEA